MFVKVLCVSYTLFLLVGCQNEVNDPCVLQSSGRQGVCQPLSLCSAAIREIQTTQRFPQNCGFIGTQPIVCCVQDAPPTAPPVTEPAPRFGSCTKCAEKCRQYGKFAITKERPPVLLFGVEEEEVSACSFKSQELVIGGEDAEPKEFPHMALIGYGNGNNIQWSCGGTLISEQYVLSAAHCLNHRELGVATRVRLGDLNIRRDDDDARPQEFSISERIPHPGYNGRLRYNDILLLKLNRPAELNVYVRPACLYTEREITAKKFIATGWGFTEYTGNPSDVLQRVVLEEFTVEKCNNTFKTSSRLKQGIKEESQICAGSKTDEKDTCSGDSGGPLQIYNKEVDCTYFVVGVTSFGKACGFANIPAVYTRVSHYLKWIEDIIWA